jgi:hypothetical protein
MRHLRPYLYGVVLEFTGEKQMKAAPPKKDVHITITVSETADGKLSLFASVPDHATGTLALQLTDTIMEGAREILNKLLADNKKLERVERH